MDNANNNGRAKLMITAVVIVATFLLMAFLVRQMLQITQPAPVGAERAGARAKDNAEIRAAGIDTAKTWGFVDQPRGIVRQPIDLAIKATLQGYQQPAAFKKDLAGRIEKASAAPPKAKNDYE